MDVKDANGETGPFEALSVAAAAAAEKEVVVARLACARLRARVSGARGKCESYESDGAAATVAVAAAATMG